MLRGERKDRAGMWQRLITRLLLLLLLVSLLFAYREHPVQAAQIFADVPDSHPQAVYINDLTTAGIVIRATNFRPNDFISRAELLKMVMGGAGHALVTLAAAPTFVDVKNDNSFFPWIETAVRRGFVSGFRDRFGRLTWLFKPWDNVTRGEAIKMTVTSFELNFPAGAAQPNYSDITPDNPFASFITIAGAYGLLLAQIGQPLKPNEKINRAEVAKLVSMARAIQLGLGLPTLTGPAAPTAQIDSQIQLTPNVNSNRPITSGQSNIMLLSLDFVPQSPRVVQLKSIEFSRSGLGTREDFTSLNLFVNGARVAGPRTITSDNKVSFLLNVLSPELSPAETTTIELRGDLKPNAANATEHIFSLSAVTNFSLAPKDATDTEPSTASAIFPLTGGALRISQVVVANLKLRFLPVKSGSETYRLGDSAVDLANLMLTAEGEDIIVRELIVTSQGVYSEFANLAIVDLDTNIPFGFAVPQLVNGKAVFDFSHEASGGLLLLDLEPRQFILRGDLAPDDATRIGQNITASQISLIIESTADVAATTKLTGLNPQVQINP